MRFLAFLFLLVLTLQNVQAIDTLTFENCENLGIQNCDEFRQLNISQEEQKKLFSSLLEIKNDMSMHDFVYDWNSKLKFDEAPNSVAPASYKTISNAWVILTGIMPSILYSNTLYSNNSGAVQTNYKYELTRPSTYFNGAWDVCGSGSTSSNEGEQGDCRTEYPTNWDASYVNVYLNGKLIGNSTLTSFNTSSSPNNFESVLSVTNKIQRNHFSWQQGNCCKCNSCCWSTGRRSRRCEESCERCGCGTHWQHCRPSGTDYRYDSLALKDSKKSQLEIINYSKPSILYDKAKSEAYFSINTTGADFYELRIGEFRILKKNFDYSYNFTYMPSNALVVVANYSSTIKANAYSVLSSSPNSDLIRFQLGEKEKYDCSLTIYSFFNSQNVSCNVSALPSTAINITTDKFFYMPNETIKANITIKSNKKTANDVIKVTYGNYSFNVTGSTILLIPVQKNVNQIKAEYQTDLNKQSASSTATISVYAGENPRYYISIFWFIIFFLLFISVLRMCWIKFVGTKDD